MFWKAARALGLTAWRDSNLSLLLHLFTISYKLVTLCVIISIGLSNMWFALLAPLITGIFGENGPIGQYFKTKAQAAQATADLALQVQKDKTTLSAVLAQAAVDSERNKLAATSSLFKSSVFWIFSSPIILTMLSPAYGKQVFDSLSIVPVDYMKMYLTLIAVIWGIPIGANALSNIMQSVQDMWNVRNQGKIAKIQALGEAQQIGRDAAKKEIFDTMKKAVGLNGYTQAQVDLINPILDKLLPGTDAPPPVANVTANTGDQQ